MADTGLDDLGDLLARSPRARRYVKKALAKAHAKGKAAGTREAEARLDGMLTRFKALKELNGSGELFKAAWDEGKHKRDHGKFSRSADSSGVSAGPQPPQKTSPIPADSTDSAEAAHPAAGKAKALLSRVAEVPAAVVTRVHSFIQGKYAKLSERYGPTGAKAVLAAMVALSPVPVPGTSLIPIAIAEAVRRIHSALKGDSMGKAVPPDGFDAEAVARQVLAELYAHCGEEMPPVLKAHDPDDTDEVEVPEPDAVVDAPHPDGDALALAMLEVVVPALELGEDPAPLLERLREKFDPVKKAWDSSKHPRDRNGRFIAKDDLKAAQTDPAKAKELRARVKPEDADKLEAVIRGDEDPGRTKRGQARHEAGQRREAKAADRARADALISKLSDHHAKPGSVELTADDLHALADHLPRMRVEDLRRARMALRASFKGNRKKEGMVEALVAHAKGMALDARSAELGFDPGEMRQAAGLDAGAGAAESTPPEESPGRYPPLDRRSDGAAMLPSPHSPAVAAVPDADKAALVRALAAESEGHLDGYQPHLAHLRRRLGWDESRFAHAFTAALMDRLVRGARDEGGTNSPRAAEEVAEHLHTDPRPGDREHYGIAAPTAAGVAFAARFPEDPPEEPARGSPGDPHPASVPAEMPHVMGGSGGAFGTLSDQMRRRALGEKLAAAGALLPHEAVEHATPDGDYYVTAGKAEVVLTNRLGMTTEDARAVLALLKPAKTVTVAGNRKRPAYDVLDLYRAAGKLYENSGNETAAGDKTPETGQPAPTTGDGHERSDSGLLSGVRGGPGERPGAGLGAGDDRRPPGSPAESGGGPADGIGGEQPPADRPAAGQPDGGRGRTVGAGEGAGRRVRGRRHGLAGAQRVRPDSGGAGAGGGRAEDGGEVVAPARKPSPGDRIDRELTDADRRALEAGPQPGPGDREPFVDTSAHAQEREEAAQDRADRMAQWAAAKPQSVQAQEVARAAKTRQAVPGAKPGGTEPSATLQKVADKLSGGRADAAPPGAFPPAKVAEGAAVEREHTSDPATAAEIARDHLAEDPDYYAKLKRVESGNIPPTPVDKPTAAVEPAGTETPAASPPKSARRSRVTPAKNLPSRQPLSVTPASHAKLKDAIKAKYVPRPPKDGEHVLLLQRPQAGAYSFQEYAVGDLIGHSREGKGYVVTAAKPGFTRGGEGWKRWEQIVIARPADDDDHAAVAAQKTDQDAETQRVLDAMTDR